MASSDTRTGRPPRTSVWLEERPASKRKGTGAGAGGGGTREQHGQSGQPEGLDREKITAAAVRLLDADGLAKFSMRRLAAELGVTAMSVYWYVDSKDDLLELAMDAAEGELDLPDPADTEADWREQLRHLAYEYRRLFNVHPWVSQMVGSYLNIGPHAMAFSHAAQGIMRRTGLPAPQLTGAMAALFQFVYGYSTTEASWNGRCRAAGLSADEYLSTVYGKIEGRAEYEDSLRLMEQGGGSTVHEMRERDFTVALDCILAGMDALTVATHTTRDRAENPHGPSQPAQSAQRP
ncbi:TetR/AcrR family transcriptional regulator [Streptomyces daliensis]